MSSVDWAAINEKLPFERTDEAKEKRRELFKQFDPNGNGYLSLAEVSYLLRLAMVTSEIQSLFPNLYTTGTRHRVVHAVAGKVLLNIHCNVPQT